MKGKLGEVTEDTRHHLDRALVGEDVYGRVEPGLDDFFFFFFFSKVRGSLIN